MVVAMTSSQPRIHFFPEHKNGGLPQASDLYKLMFGLYVYILYMVWYMCIY